MYIHVYIYIYTDTCIHTYINAYMHTYVTVHIHIHICMYYAGTWTIGVLCWYLRPLDQILGILSQTETAWRDYDMLPASELRGRSVKIHHNSGIRSQKPQEVWFLSPKPIYHGASGPTLGISNQRPSSKSARCSDRRCTCKRSPVGTRKAKSGSSQPTVLSWEAASQLPYFGFRFKVWLLLGAGSTLAVLVLRLAAHITPNAYGVRHTPSCT